MARDPEAVSNKTIGPHRSETSGRPAGFGRLVSGQLDKAQRIAVLSGGPIKVAHAPGTKVANQLADNRETVDWKFRPDRLEFTCQGYRLYVHSVRLVNTGAF